MDYNQFKNLLRLKGMDSKESLSMLEELIAKFPYFQSARLLLAKSMHEQENIHAKDALKMAAAYATDRNILRDLIEKKKATADEIPIFKAQSTDAFSSKEIKVEHSESYVLQDEDEPFQEYYSEDEISGRAFEEQKELEKVFDPHEVIRRRLSEILVVKEEETKQPEEKNTVPPPEKKPIEVEDLIKEKTYSTEGISPSPNQVVSSPNVEEEKLKSEKPITSEEILIQEAERAHDVLDKMEVEHAMEESILASLEKLPVIAPEKEIPSVSYFEEKRKLKEEQASVPDTESPSEPKTFTQWLKAISPRPYHQYEEVHLTDKGVSDIERNEISAEQLKPPTVIEQEPEMNEDELIDKFIINEPRIIPSKAEFYSPANQAKKSVMEHEDVVSETLARIYHHQGNLAKAKWCYEKLSLLHPEKNSYFAALLEEIKNEESKMKS